MSLSKAATIGGIAGISVPFVIGGSMTPLARLLGVTAIHGPYGATLPWSWPVFCLATLAAWGLLHFSRS
jgi:hypothetical protein